jgi:hypothetical protein
MASGTIGAAYAEYCEAMRELIQFPWRQGHDNPCNVYAVVASRNYKDDIDIGHFMTPELAKEAVDSHNA